MCVHSRSVLNLIISVSLLFSLITSLSSSVQMKFERTSQVASKVLKNTQILMPTNIGFICIINANKHWIPLQNPNCKSSSQFSLMTSVISDIRHYQRSGYHSVKIYPLAADPSGRNGFREFQRFWGKFQLKKKPIRPIRMYL